MLGIRLWRSIFIRTQKSPNPAFLQFYPGSTVIEEGTIDYPSLRLAANCPLAVQLFQIEGVSRVFLSKDYVGIGKSQEKNWENLKPLIFEVLMDYFSSGKSVISDVPQDEDTKINDTDSEDLAMIKEIIEYRVKPFVRDDGGDVRFLSFDEEAGVVTLEMRGSCAGCPSSAVTLKNGIEKMLTHYVPKVKKVEGVDA
ncbi:unnamed protein product [Blepharisma stoltei]|uniref:Scaffold protein Nfu/NifU N-terminal domain-containing protein n=1 Tax=Blepharisma stoltei TaxID=1481888 RepID=A0AAU9I9R9_9CILI|nr:unnamed protein product [Blepharisma stoltei]